MDFNNILKKCREDSFSERDKGARFEHLMQAYLLTDPQYACKFKKVWLWNDFFRKDDLGGGDTGIDLVAQTFDAARAIASVEFASDSRYSEIFAQYFENNAQVLARDPPEVFIDELTREMWKSDSAELVT
jgi:predicted helicase